MSPFHTLTHDNTRSFSPNTARNRAPCPESPVPPPSHLKKQTNTFRANNPQGTPSSPTRSRRGNEALTCSLFHTLTHDKLRSHTLFFPAQGGKPHPSFHRRFENLPFSGFESSVSSHSDPSKPPIFSPRFPSRTSVAEHVFWGGKAIQCFHRSQNFFDGVGLFSYRQWTFFPEIS